jgi:hypothetical protein
MGCEQRIIPRPQRGQETIASVLVLIWIHVGPTSPSARHSTPVRSLPQATNRFQTTSLIRNSLAAASTADEFTRFRLYAKELVMHNFVGLPADQLLEHMVELSLRTEEHL